MYDDPVTVPIERGENTGKIDHLLQRCAEGSSDRDVEGQADVTSILPKSEIDQAKVCRCAMSCCRAEGKRRRTRPDPRRRHDSCRLVAFSRAP